MQIDIIKNILISKEEVMVLDHNSAELIALMLHDNAHVNLFRLKDFANEWDVLPKLLELGIIPSREEQ